MIPADSLVKQLKYDTNFPHGLRWFELWWRGCKTFYWYR